MFKLAELFVEVGAVTKPLDNVLAGVKSKLAGLANMRFNLPGGGLMGALGLSAAGLGLAAIVKGSVDLQTRMVALSKATDLEGQALEGMKQQLMALSTTVKGVRLDDLIDIATSGAKMGVATQDLLKYTEGIAKVSTAIDDMPAGEIADRIGKLNTVFKLGVTGAMQLGSAIDKLADSGVSSASGILDVTSRISGSAVAARISAQETVALAAALLDTGTQSELASSALLDLIAALNQVQGRAAMAKSLGMGLPEFAEMVKDKPTQALQAFLKQLATLDAAGQLKTLVDVGIKGDTHGAEIMKLAQQADNLGKYVGMANSEFKTLDQITKSYNATAATTGAQFAVTQNKLQILADTVGSALLPGINTALGLVNDLATGMTGALGRMGESVQSWGVDFSGAVELASAGFLNLGDVGERTGVMIGGALLNAWEYLKYGGEVAGKVASYFLDSFVEAFQATMVAAGNLKDNFVALLKELWEAIKSGGTHIIDVKFKPLLEGMEFKGDGKFVMPELNLSSVDNQLAAIDQRMADREAKRTADQAAAKAKGAGAGGGATNPNQAPGTATPATSSKLGVTDSDTFARELQDGALKAGDVANKQLTNLQAINDKIDKIIGYIPKGLGKKTLSTFG